MGIITGWVSQYSEWISGFGIFGWWVSGLIGAAVTVIAIAAVLFARAQLSRAKYMESLRRPSTAINPMESQFTRQRIMVADLVDPVGREINGKTLIDCDLVGPYNLVFYQSCTFSHVAFVDCDVVPLKRGAGVKNAAVLRNISMTRGRLIGVTILITPDLIPNFRAMQSTFIAIAEDEVSHIADSVH
ncbi:hypothetical protein GOC46_04240 [Sinorhizobium meliloti]|nr:hypothetical protein [Sinorhizobium meliloti]MDX0379432.1 hypothetical protein [Sinorhizobium meliloti]